MGLSSVQFSCSVVSDSLRPHESQHARPPCPPPSPRVHSDSVFIKSVMPSSHLILCRPLLLLPPILPSSRVFSNESTLRRRWPKYWSFIFSISPSKEHLIVREMQIKTTMKYHLTLFKWTTIKKSTHNKCWRECGKKETFLHSWWECKLVQPLENSVELPCGPAIPFLGT